MRHEKPNSVQRIHSQQYLRAQRNLCSSENRNSREPYSHHWTKYSAYSGCSFFLENEQSEQNRERRGHDDKPESGSDYLETLGRAEHRNRRCDHTVAVEQCCPDNSEIDDCAPSPLIAGSSLPLKQKGKQSEHSSFTAVVGAKNENDVLDAHDEDE